MCRWLAQGIPDLRIVFDHLGKPPIVGRGFEPWGSLLARAARMPNVFAKMSGLDVDEDDRWTAADIAPYVDHALELFGPDRLMFGSDWPVAILRGGYAKVWHETNVALARLSRDSRRVYSLRWHHGHVASKLLTIYGASAHSRQAVPNSQPNRRRSCGQAAPHWPH
jgi:predicted TIM-barrel fold metal-dependent hydrolase